ncbi:uncharacterized protein PFLUO_LOCUS1812 [Penicillium psychrofluorescens]|uniref:uncharacterized protein n=1 Tax=Penicillium psychrofluorescens TaxID=3158075 RepID=UPI003CCCF0EC
MQFKILATLLLSSTALVSANDAVMTASSGSSDSSETNPDSSSMLIAAIPHSILTALETAIPTSWYTDIMQPKFRSSVESEIMAGTMPAWYNNLPQSVKAWASSEGGMINHLIGAEPTSAPVGAASSNTPATGAPAHNTASSTMSTAAATTTGKGGSGGSGGSGASGTTTSGTKKSSPSSSVSTGGAPIATGGVAAGIAGVAGILGLALAL